MLSDHFVMERDRGLNFKLWVPPRVNNGQTSAVRPQEVVESYGDFMNPSQQGYSRCFDKGKNMPFPNASMVTPSKSISQDFPKIKVVPPLEKYENNCHPGQLCSKLFDEVEKIKSWKVKVDSDTVQRERRLHENKRTIETQRKAIQELQFGNESLSIKLEEQISENEDLRNKNNATRNLCNILKDTFERSAEKMQLFESEREETNHIFVENCERIQKLTAAFESLWIRVESDKEEMQKVKEGLLQLDELKEKYFQEYNMKEEEVAELQLKLKNKDNELQNILLDLHETQKRCSQLEEATNQQYEVLQSSKAEQKSLLQKLQTIEQSCEEAEKNRDAIAAALRQSEEEYAQTIQSKDLSLQDLSRVKNQQAEKLEQIQTTIKELQKSLSIQMQSTNELEEKLIANNEELERKDTLLKETMEQSAKKDGQIRILEDELDMRLKSIESMKGKIDKTEMTVEELTAELSRKAEEIKVFKNEAEMVFAENELLKKACEAAEKAQDDLKKKSTITEGEVQELQGQLFTEIKKNEEHVFKMEQLSNDIALHKVKYEGLLSNFNELQSEKMAIQQQFESGSSHVKAIEADIKVSEEKAVKLARENQKLREENQHFREEINCVKTKVQEKCQETETLQKKIDKNCQLLQEKIIGKEKQIKILETKVCNLREKVKMKLEAQEKYQKENKLLKKQIAKETAKSSKLENEMCSLHDESQNLEKVSEEVKQKLLKDLEHKSTLAAELENEMQKLRLSSAEAIKNKEDAELKCHHKIADMVALMEKHKSQYDRMVEEKDAELDETKKKEVEAVAQKKALEVDLTKHKTENDELRKQLKIETTNKENLQKELTDFKKEMSSMKITQLAEAENKQAPASKCEHRRFSDTPKESASKRHIYDCFKTRRTPSYFKDKESAAVIKKAESDNESLRTSRGTTPKTKDIHTEDMKTPSMTNKAGGTSKIKSYRIRTPPSTEKGAGWGKGAIEFDPKSDSSDQNDLLTFVNAPTPDISNPRCECNTIKKIQSPVSHKSPGNSLKLAAMKRMRDAGWTAVTGSDKKKKMNNEKIFA